MTRFTRHTTDWPVDRDQEQAAKDPVACMLQCLRSPLSTILGEAGVAEPHLADLPATVRRAICRVAENASRMERVLCDVLDHIDEVSGGGIRISRERVDLALMLTQLIPRVVPLHGQHRIRLEIRETAIAHVDSPRMQRVIGSLVDNALRHSLADAEVLVRLDSRNDHATITIADPGPGLTSDQAKAIFDVSSSYARVPLFVSRKIVEAHGGRIVVDSVPGKGARFSVELPLLR